MSEEQGTEAQEAQEAQVEAGDVAQEPVAGVVMVVDADAGDRAVYSALVGRCGPELAVIEAAGIEAAVEAAMELEALALFIIGVEEESATVAFDLRDALVERFGESLTGAFCGPAEAFAELDRAGDDRVFYKPVDDAVMMDWLTEHLGTASPEANTEIESSAADSSVTEEVESVVDSDEAAAMAIAADADPAEGGGDSSMEEDPDLLAEGTELGDYRISRLLRHNDTTAMYVAEQRSVNRSVALKALHHRHRTDPEQVGAFVDEARSRALVSHADVALVYQADQKNGITYYAIELLGGPNLAQLLDDGTAVDEDTLFDVLGSVADILLYLKEADLSVVPIQASMIHLPNGESCRIANPVNGSGPCALDEPTQMRLLAEAVQPFLGRSSPLLPLVQRLGNTAKANAILTAEGLNGALDALEAAGIPEPETPKQVERRADQRSMVVGGVIGGLIVVAGLIFMIMSGADKDEVRSFDYMVPVPAGSFAYQDKETIELPAFWIDEYEVTIGQYAEFLAAIESDPPSLKKFQHELQPESKRTHQPPDWDRYYPAAQRGGSFGGTPISLDCPVVQVDWWDAHAYAGWRGGRLPTEQEWEKAARSRSGNLYPWGNELDIERFNSGADQKAAGDIAAGAVDGYQYWSPVDAKAGDESQYGVRGMAGNVSEWTASLEPDPDFPDRQVPIIRGASFRSQDNFDLKRRVPAASRDTTTLYTGFRTVRDSAPPKPANDAATEVAAD